MKKRMIQWGTAALAVTVFCGAWNVNPASGAQNTSLQADYQQISDIVQGGNMTQGKPQNPYNNVTIGVSGNASAQSGNGDTQIILRDETGNEIGRYSSGDSRLPLADRTSTVVSSYLSGSSSRDEEDNWGYGPGATSPSLEVEVRDDNNDTGPQVEEVRMGETYHEDYDIYTESIDDQFFIYTNVGNNGITDQPVYLDIPQNISFTAEKDGVPIAYTSNQHLSATGTYIFRFTAIKDASKPLSEQVIYETTFNFRIQPKSPKATAGSGEGEVEYYGSSHSTTAPTEYPTLGQGESIGQVSAAEEETALEETEELPLPQTETAESEDGAPEGMELAEETEENAEDQESVSGNAASGVLGETYDPVSGMYRIELSDGKSFSASVPNGMLSNIGVFVDFSGLGSGEQNVEILLDGTPYVPAEDGTFSQTGNYTLLIPDGTGRKVFSFRLIGTAVSNLDSYTIPAGMKIVSLTRDGEVIGDTLTGQKQNVDFTRDGSYSLFLENSQGVSYQIDLVIDHQPPVFSAIYDGEKAVLSYESDDVARIDLTDGKGTLKSYEALNQIVTPGKYLIQVYDVAGNMSQTTVEVPDKVNIAGVIAIVMIIGLISGAVVFIRRTKKDFHVQ